MAKNKSTKAHSARDGGMLAKEQTSSSNKTKTFASNWLSEPKLMVLSFLLFGLIVAVFLPATRNDFFYWYGDDPLYVTENSHVNTGLTLENIRWAFSFSGTKSSAGVENSNLHPLTWISHMMACEIFGLKAWGHHLINVLLHAANTVLLFMLLKTMTGAMWRSLAVALLFGLHPLRVESVAWVSERKDVLSGFFWMLSLLFYVRYAAKETDATRSKSKIFYALALIGFAGGLMSKTMVVTLPCVLLLLDYWPLQRWQKKNIWPLLLEKVPFFLLSGVLSILEVMGTKSANFVQTMEIYPLAIRLENAVVSYARYLGKMFWPVDLCSLYPHPGQWPMGIIFMAVVLVLGISILAFVLRRKCPWLLVGWCWYLGTLVPVIGLVQIGNAAMADRFSYIPMIGFLMALVWGLHEWTKRWRYQTVVWSSVITAVLISHVVITERQIGYFKDDVTAWRHNFEVTGNAEVAQSALGLSLSKQGRLEEGIKELQAVLRSNPELPNVHFNLATMFDKMGRVDEAIIHYSQAIKLLPKYNDARLGLGQNLVRKGQIKDAIVQFEKMLELNGDPRAYIPLGQSLASDGRLAEAIEQMRAALKINPNRYDAHLDLALMFHRQKRMAEATQHFIEAVKLGPQFSVTQSRLGLVLNEQGRTDEALPYLREAVRLNRKSHTYDSQANDALGDILARKGLVDELIECLNESLKHAPADFSAHANLGFALTAKGLTNEAVHHLEEAIRLNPKFTDAITFLESVKRTGKAPSE